MEASTRQTALPASSGVARRVYRTEPNVCQNDFRRLLIHNYSLDAVISGSIAYAAP
jgi:hypothetical protein